MRGAVRIGACQPPEILGDADAAVRCILEFCAQAEREVVDLLLFPECFLRGYLVTEAHLLRHALDLRSARFRSLAARLADVRPVLVIGVIERSGGGLFNSAVVLEHGEVAGAYRKTHLTPGETLFSTGNAYPVFHVRGLRYGVNTGMWLVSADVTGERGDTHVAYGPTSVMTPSAEVVAQVPPMETGMVTAQIPVTLHRRGSADKVSARGF